MEVRGFLNDSALKGLSCFAAQMHISGSPQKGAGGELSQHPSPWAPWTISLGSPGIHEDLTQLASTQPSLS